MRSRSMRRFWDDRASENPYFFVDNRLRYSEPDLERFWAGGREALDRSLDRFGARLRRTDVAVEVGCGVGRLTRVLAERCASVHAIDISEQMIDTARELNAECTNVEWMVGDGHSLASIADASADVCYSDVVFQHIPHPQITLGYIAEISRVLRPGGWAIFQVSNDPAIHVRRPRAERARAALRGLLGRGPRGQAHSAWLGSAVELDDVRSCAGVGGAIVERVEGAGTQYCYVLLRKHPS